MGKRIIWSTSTRYICNVIINDKIRMYILGGKKMKDNYQNVKWQENGKLKLLIIVGTRPEIIRLSAVITKCRKYFDCILAHTGQNYDYNLNGVFFKDLKLDDPEVYMDAVG